MGKTHTNHPGVFVIGWIVLRAMELWITKSFYRMDSMVFAFRHGETIDVLGV